MSDENSHLGLDNDNAFSALVVKGLATDHILLLLHANRSKTWIAAALMELKYGEKKRLYTFLA